MSSGAWIDNDDDVVVDDRNDSSTDNDVTWIVPGFHKDLSFCILIVGVLGWLPSLM